MFAWPTFDAYFCKAPAKPETTGGVKGAEEGTLAILAGGKLEAELLLSGFGRLG